MSLLCETTHFSKMPEKRLFEHSGYGNRGFPRNLKRPKIDAVRQFPRARGKQAPQVSKSQTKTDASVVAIGIPKVAEDRAILPVKPLGILVPRGFNSETVKPLGSVDIVEALEQNNTVKMEAPKVFEIHKSANEEDNAAQIKQIDDSSDLKILTRPLATKYPPPKIRKGFSAFRKFPPGCGSKSQFSSSKPNVCAHNHIAEHSSIPQAVETNLNGRVNAFREFPLDCGSTNQFSASKHEVYVHNPIVELNPKMKIIETNVNQVKTVRNSKAAEEGPTFPVKPSGILLPGDLNCKSVKPLASLEIVEALEQNNAVKMEAPKVFEKGKLANVEEKGGQIKQIDNSSNLKISTKRRLLATKYPPPKIRKGFSAFRKFPPGCGSMNQFSSASEPEVYSQNPIAEHSEILETVETNLNKRVDTFRVLPPGCGSTDQFSASKHEVYAHNPIFEHNLEMKIIETNVNQIRREINEGHGFERNLEGNGPKEFGDNDRDGESSVECEFKEEEDIVEMILMPLLEGNSLQPDCNCRVVRCEVDERETSHECFDEVPLFGNNVIPEQQLECVSNLERSKANEDISTDLSIVFLDTRENSNFFVSKSADKYSRQLHGDYEKQEIAVKESINLSIVPFEDHQAIINRYKVTEALNLFAEIFNNLMRQHQRKSSEHENFARNIHTEAAAVLKKQHKWVNENEKIFGAVPGVEIGDEFHFRVQLCIVGLHWQPQAGIDYAKKEGTNFATSIVDSGRYANDVESSEVLIYSGQGGNPLGVHKEEPQDQTLERGNLALKHSMDAKIPVRVIRSRQTKASETFGTRSGKFEKRYFYDGLYIVTKCWQERGRYGKLVFMFQLNRMPTQLKLTQKVVKRSKKSNVLKDICVVGDISKGQEKMPIRAMNMIDDEKPPPFNYITKMVYPEIYNHPSPRGCDCTNGCLDHVKCSCSLKNGGEISFNNSGVIIRAKHIIYECGHFCKCLPSCNNRVSQHGIRYQLEIFKTESRGWGIRSRNYISLGSFICEYIGELLTDKEAEQRIDNDEYLFDIGKDHNGNIYQDENGNGFTIDAARYGNVGRFINHSCSPNVYAQEVLYDHDDTRMPHIMLFASRNIPPLRELTYNYNYKVDQVRDVNGNVKKKNCYCGSRECNGRMY